MNKVGASDEGIIMIYRIFMVTLVSFTILGISSVFYAHYIDVRDVEAKILTRDVVECLSPNGILDLDSISEDDRKNILSYCGFEESEVERFYVEVEITYPGKSIIKLSQGDSGSLWVLGIFHNKGADMLEKYKPGYYQALYASNIILDKNKKRGNLYTQVLVKDEF